MTGELTDHELLALWADGDNEAGTLLVRRHFESLSRFFRSRADQHRVDLMQKTWLGCIESRARFPKEVPFKAYLMGIARRVLIHHYREVKKARRIDPAAKEEASPRASPSRKMIMAAEETMLLQALRRLPLDMQLTLELFYWEEMQVTEVAMVLDIPPGTVKSRLHRARQLLREQIAVLEPADEIAQSTAANLEHWAKSIRRFLGRDSTLAPLPPEE